MMEKEIDSWYTLDNNNERRHKGSVPLWHI